jgi:hypothetical protein
MESTKYASVRVKVETYREMKQVALDAGIPFTRLMDEMLMAYKEKLAKDTYIPDKNNHLDIKTNAPYYAHVD